jgi:YVTN family beta-propeller protein
MPRLPLLAALALAVVVAVAAAILARGARDAAPAPAAPAPAPPQTAAAPADAEPAEPPLVTVPGMPPVPDPRNLYSEIAAGKLSAAVAGALPRIYVPNRVDGTVSVIDPETLKVVRTLRVGVNPQHVVPSYDLTRLWVANNAEGRADGSLTPIDPTTGRPGRTLAVDDPYNLYWSPDGKSAIVVAEAFKRLDFRDPHTMALQHSIETPQCAGINHADFSIDGRYALFTCEFAGSITKIDLTERRVVGTIPLSAYFNRPDALAAIEQAGPTPRLKVRYIPDPSRIGAKLCATPGMPQDVRASPDGKMFYVADMMSGGVHVVDGHALRQIGFIPTGVGTHGLYPSRDGKLLYVANRGTTRIGGPRGGQGSVSVIEFATQKVLHTWPIPGGGSPDMGNVSADGRHLWLAGRYDDVVYRIATDTGDVDKIAVGREPHGLTVWPQPGRYSLGHTGNLR